MTCPDQTCPYCVERRRTLEEAIAICETTVKEFGDLSGASARVAASRLKALLVAPPEPTVIPEVH